MGNQGPYHDASGDGGFKRPGDFLEVEPKDQDVDALLRLFDGGHDRPDSGIGLNNQVHPQILD
jgi:hypothetical protein